MQLADFILANIEPILANWEVFARTAIAGAKMDALALRDHAEDILRATVRDMNTAQSDTQQTDKSTGRGAPGIASTRLDVASEVHGVGRVGSGFNLGELVAEYRALRASVIRLWRATDPSPHLSDLDDLTRFNESIDQSLRKAVVSYTKRVDQSRRMFLAILAHDLRGPLNSIMLSTAVMSMDADPASDTADAASRIKASATAITQMVADLLDFAGSHVGAGMPLSPKPMNLATLCQEVFEEFRASHTRCELKLGPPSDLTGVWDSNRLRQVLSNLLGNAAQHGGADCDVTLSAASEGPGEVLLQVHNVGKPIPPEILPLIFDPLVQGSPQGAPRRPGSIGLGLYIAREVVIAHGGTIDVISTEESGTTFTVRLPRGSQPGHV